MEMKRYTGIYFSPAGTTKKVTEAVAAGMGTAVSVDITARPVPVTAERENCVVAGVPVFAGRVPPVAAEHLRQLRGDQTPAVALVVYGNRAYDDALLELKDILEKQGFVVIAAGAFVAQHSIASKYAHGRPDEGDLKTAEDFGRDAARKLASITDTVYMENLRVPGNLPYREYKAVPFHPSAGKSCNGCGLCARECPVSAIPESDPKRTDNEICMSCMHCVAVCPNHARQLSAVHRTMAEVSLAKSCKEVKYPKLFI